MAQASYDAYNAQDWDTVASCYHPDVVVWSPGGTVTGRDAVVSGQRAEQEALAHRDEVDEIVVDGAHAYVTHHLELPVGDGGVVRWPLLSVLTVLDGLVVADRTYWGSLPPTG